LRDKVLILGSAGLIGHQVYNFLRDSDSFELHDISHRNKIQDGSILLSARDEKLFIDEIKDIKPNYIINCMGILINGSKSNPEDAIFLNAYMPHRLTRMADEINAKLIHISTDCVFSGNKKGPYIERDRKDGSCTYALSKGLGEIINEKHLTLRTSVVGPELKIDGEELFHWFMNQRGDIKGFTKAIWSGVTTIELAKAVKWSIDHNITGLYHVTNNSAISKHDLLQLFKKYTNKKINIEPSDAKVNDKSFIDTRQLLNYKIPSYDEMIFDMVELIKNNELYNQYKF
jgi:dTDP-4-dehydrorhamnose reductase